MGFSMNTLKTIILSLITATSLSAAEPKKTIILDPGHEPWNKNYGASGEAQANLVFSRALETIINEHEKYNAILTCNDLGYDQQVNRFGKVYSHVISSRAKIREHEEKQKSKKKRKEKQKMSRYDQMLYARGLFFHPDFSPEPLHATAFVSLHYNDTVGNNPKKYHGFCVYYKPQEKYGMQSKELAISLCNALTAEGYKKSTNPGERFGHGEHPKNLIVLRTASREVPAVLIELGYITHKKDKEDAFNKEKVAEKARVVYRALDDFLSRRK